MNTRLGYPSETFAFESSMNLPENQKRARENILLFRWNDSSLIKLGGYLRRTIFMTPRMYDLCGLDG